MKRSFRITPRAAQDLRNIARYTLQTWGRKQRDTYLRAIDRRFSWLAENPNLGKPRPEIKEAYKRQMAVAAAMIMNEMFGQGWDPRKVH